MIRVLIAFAVLVTALAAPVHAQIGIDIGIHLPGPPALFVVQGSPVYYAPRAPGNVFFYAHQYWVFTNGWYVGPTWNGPWALVEPQYVPQPLLQVPVAYYPVPPPHWREWRREGPPRWEAHSGREWREEAHERDWREREEHWGRGCPPGLAKQGRC
jgi:hypothetical protein